MMLEFYHPNYLYLLFLIPLLIVIHFISLKTERSRAVKFANFEAIARIKGVDIYSKNLVVLSISIVIVILLSLSLAGLTVHTQVKTSKMSFVLAIDASKSMEANDFTPNRMGAAKSIAENFVRSQGLGTRIGIVSFSGNSFIEQKITDDKDLLVSKIEKIGIKELGGTDIAEAVITSTDMLADENYKAILLLSDGQINVAGLDDAVNYAKDNDVIIYSIAIGTAEGGQTAFGISKVDEDSLKALSYNTGGIFFSTKNNQDLQDAFDKISVTEVGNVAIELSKYLLIMAVVLFVIEFFLSDTRFRGIP